MVNSLLFSLCLVVLILIWTKNPLIFGEGLFFLFFIYFWTENPLILQRRPFFLVFAYFWYEKGCHHEIPPRVPPFLATPLIISTLFSMALFESSNSENEGRKRSVESYFISANTSDAGGTNTKTLKPFRAITRNPSVRTQTC